MVFVSLNIYDLCGVFDYDNIFTCIHHTSSYGFYIPYSFGYKTDFPIQNNPKDVISSYKTDLDLWDCLGMVKHVL